tara:strand:- start:7112 stop:7912 length:801 start_codon:yes stop_codon:yes gene_type:complete
MTQETDILSMNINEKLNIIQCELKAPKGQRNEFGNFNFRHIEDILGNLKPLLSKTGTTVLFTDEVIEMGNRLFFKATCIFSDGEGDNLQSTGLAEVSDHRKGMDQAQLSGLCSSYARKYAACGMFAVDGNEDIDSMQAPAAHHNGAPLKKGCVTQEQSIKLDRYARDPKTMASDVTRIKKVTKGNYTISEAEATILIADIEHGRKQNMEAPKKIKDSLRVKLTKLKKDDWIKHLDKEGWTNLNCEHVTIKLKESENGIRSTSKTKK